MINRDQAINYAHINHEHFLESLKSLVRIPSVSTDTEHKQDMVLTAEWLADALNGINCANVQILPTGGHPVVYAEKLDAGPDKPTVLIYGHYDVQPPAPLDLWNTDPFSPDQRGKNLFGRGASDMKGQIVASIKAVESVLKTTGLPLNVKFIFEGEEEIGSPNLPAWLKEHTELLKCDVALNPDAGMINSSLPTITYGLRGLAYYEIRLYGPDHDLHSGLFGGVVHNPAQVICDLIAGMHDKEGRVTLPGYYDKVRPLDDDERKALARLPIGDDFYLKQTGAPALWGETGYTAAERTGGRPTLEVNGIYSGFTGTGSKTVIPAWAMAKISMRLVPDQDPNEVQQQLSDYLSQNAPNTVRWELIPHAGGFASISDRYHPATIAMHKSMEKVWGVEPVYKREGGSVPIVGEMQKILGVESVLTGFSLPEDNVHSPNEKLHLPTWYRGIDSLIHFLYEYAES